MAVEVSVNVVATKGNMPAIATCDPIQVQSRSVSAMRNKTYSDAALSPQEDMK